LAERDPLLETVRGLVLTDDASSDYQSRLVRAIKIIDAPSIETTYQGSFLPGVTLDLGGKQRNMEKYAEAEGDILDLGGKQRKI
jgi:hypothetical protein